MAFGDGERISLGEVTLEIRHTPGHTPESISIVVYEHADDETPYAVLTGDTHVHRRRRPTRPALVERASRPTTLAEQLYDSLHESAADPARRDTRVSGPWRRVRVWQEPVDRHVVDHR